MLKNFKFDKKVEKCLSKLITLTNKLRNFFVAFLQENKVILIVDLL